MLWSCMTCNGPGYACTIEDGTMKASDHVHILSATLMDSLRSLEGTINNLLTYIRLGGSA